MLNGLLFFAAAAPAGAQQETPLREAEVIVYGDDPCPQSTDDEVVVCARRPEEERYRIPPALRDHPDPRVQAWGTRAEDLEEAQRDSRPDSCSVVGTGGQTGCRQQMLRQWYRERRTRSRRPY